MKNNSEIILEGGSLFAEKCYERIKNNSVWVDCGAKEHVFRRFEISMSQQMMTRTTRNAKKSSSTRYDVIIYHYEYTFSLRRAKSSKAATPKKMKKSSLSEIVASPSASANSWKESFDNCLQEPFRKPRVCLDESVFDSLLSSAEKRLKSGKKSDETKLVSNDLSKNPQVQSEMVSGLDVSAGRVSLWA